MRGCESGIGITAHVTDFAGIGGRIRVSPQDFIVEEVIKRQFLGSIKEECIGPSLAIFTLSKGGIDSIHATRLISKILGSKVRILGLKDSRASTNQYLALRVKKPLPRLKTD